MDHIAPPRNKGGVEEKKEDDSDIDQSSPLRQPLSPKAQSAYETMDKDGDEDESGIGASIESFAKAVFGSCGQAVEAASYMVQGQCRWPTGESAVQARGGKAPLSIAEELRKLAIHEGRQYQPQPVSQARTADIPTFLGEDAVNSFEDDNISALSQHTLEEMVSRNNGKQLHPMCRSKRQSRSNASLHTPPSPTRTTSLSTSSSDKHQRGRHKDERSV